MPRRLLRTFLAALTALLLAAVAVAAPKWHTLQAPHCLIVSQLSERDTRAWASEFEQFTAALRSKIQIEERFLPPLTVVLFSGPSTFGPYRAQNAAGKKREIAGFFATRDTWGVIGLAESFSDEATRHVVLHEATHWMASATRTALPLWLNEGVAEVFSTFQPKKDHGLLGEPIRGHLAALQNEKWVPLLQLLLTTGGDDLYTNNKRKPIFYAQSWMLTHKLFFEDPQAGHAILNKFFAARLLGTDQVSAFEKACGKDLPTLERELERYARDGRFSFTKLALPPESTIEGPYAPASPLTVEIALARLAMGSRLHPLARTHIERALTLDPSSPVPRELLALLELELKNNDAATASARRALELGSRDAWMHITVAHELWRRHNDRGSLDSAAREIADHLTQAIALQPKLRTAYNNFASLASLLPEVTLADAQLLADGYKLFPDEPQLLVGLAALLHKAGNEAEAQRLLSLALDSPASLTEEQRAKAERLRLDWKIEPLRQKIDDLAKQRRFGEALASCELLLQEPMPQQPRRRWEQRRDDLRFQAALQEAQQFRQTGQPAEAIRVLEALIAQPGVSEHQRRQVRERLERLRRNQPQSEPTPL